MQSGTIDIHMNGNLIFDADKVTCPAACSNSVNMQIAIATAAGRNWIVQTVR